MSSTARIANRLLIVLPCVIALLAIAPAAALATEYFAAPADQGTHDCLSTANACKLVTAIATAGGTGDTINMAGGFYQPGDNPLLIVQTYTIPAGHDGLTIVGAGPNDTVIRPITGATSGTALEIVSNNVTVRDLQIDDSNLFHIHGYRAMQIEGTGEVADNILVHHDPSSLGADNPAIAVIGLNPTGLTLSHSTVLGGIVETGLIDAGPQSTVTLNDDDIRAGGTDSSSRAVDVQRATVTINRSVIEQQYAGADALFINDGGTDHPGSITLSSSVVEGGNHSIESQFFAAGSTITLRVRDSILDAGANLTSDGGDLSIYSNTIIGTSHTLNAAVDSSVVREPIGVGVADPSDTLTTTCSYSDVPDPPTAIPTSVCDSTHNHDSFHAAGSDLFVTPFDSVVTDAGFYAPLPGGPLMNKGNPAALVAGESTTDLGGLPRVSSNTCTPVRDIGARELQQTPPAASVCHPIIIVIKPKPKPPVISNVFAITKVKAGKKGTVVVTLVAAGAGSFSARATAKVKPKATKKHKHPKAKTTTYGTGKASSTNAGTVTLTIKANHSGAANLKRLKKLKLSLKVTFTPTGGTAASHTAKATVKAPATKKKSKK